LVAVDVSGSQSAPEIRGRVLATVAGQARFAVACAAKTGSAHFELRLFATNAAQTATVVSRELRVGGATEIARYRKADKEAVAESLVADIGEAFGPAVDALPAKASDVLSQFPLAVEHLDVLESRSGVSWALDFMVLTDGFATTPKALGKVKTTAEAVELAEATRQATPALDGAWRVSLVGVGRVAGDKQPSTGQIDAIKAFWRTYLDGTAEQVTVATDFPGASGLAEVPTSPTTTATTATSTTAAAVSAALVTGAETVKGGVQR
jgi:hypothetical protein